MRAVNIIAGKLDGRELTREEAKKALRDIAFFLFPVYGKT